MPERLPIIPPATAKRTAKVQDAYLIWARGNEDGTTPSWAEVARQAGVYERNGDTAQLRVIANTDGWKEHRLALLQERADSHEGTQLAIFNHFEGHPDDIERIKAEQERQVAEIPHLVTETERVLQAIKLAPASSKVYSTMVSTLERLTNMLEKRSGKVRYDNFTKDLDAARIRKAEDEKPKLKTAQVVEV